MPLRFVWSVFVCAWCSMLCHLRREEMFGIMRILLELLNFCKHLYSTAQCLWGRDRLQTQAENKPEGWPHAGWLWQLGGAGEQVEPGPRHCPPLIPPSLRLGDPLARKQSRAAKRNLGHPHGICKWFLISETGRNAKVGKTPSCGEKRRGRQAAEGKFPMTGYGPALCNRLFLARLSAVEECSRGSALAWKLSLLD